MSTGTARELLDPIFRDQPGVIAGPARDDGDAVHCREVEIARRQRHLALERAHIALKSLGNDDRLLENLLLHVVAVIALLDRRRRSSGLDDLPFRGPIVAIEDLYPVAMDDRPVALVEIGDTLRPRSDREGVRAEVILAIAIADGQRSASARSR